MADYIKTTDAITTTWMILRGMGYDAEDNPDMVKTVAAVFNTAPAADVVEVKHGHWHDVYMSSASSFVGTCSICGISNDIPPVSLAKYCPNCGAKMDGGHDDV